MSILISLKGGSFSTTNVMFDGNEKFVRKSISISDNREYGFIRWQSQIKKLQLLKNFLPNETISIEKIGIDDKSYFYDMAYQENCIDCYQALLYGESPELIVSEVLKLIKKMSEISLVNNNGSMLIYINEEILSPLLFAEKSIKKSKSFFNDNEINDILKKISRALLYIDKLLNNNSFMDIQESIIHGNLTLENLLWNTDTKKIMMIDPYSESYCDSILGDISQRLQSSQSGYEFISNNYETNNILKYPLNLIPHNFLLFSNLLIDKVKLEKWFNESYLNLFKASQFTRMFPFKIEKSPRQAFLFLLHGIDLLENTL